MKFFSPFPKITLTSAICPHLLKKDIFWRWKIYLYFRDVLKIFHRGQYIKFQIRIEIILEEVMVQDIFSLFYFIFPVLNAILKKHYRIFHSERPIYQICVFFFKTANKFYHRAIYCRYQNLYL